MKESQIKIASHFRKYQVIIFCSILINVWLIITREYVFQIYFAFLKIHHVTSSYFNVVVFL